MTSSSPTRRKGRHFVRKPLKRKEPYKEAVLVLKLSFGQGFGLSGRTRGQKEFQKVKAAEKGNWNLEVEQKQ